MVSRTVSLPAHGHISPRGPAGDPRPSARLGPLKKNLESCRYYQCKNEKRHTSGRWDLCHREKSVFSPMIIVLFNQVCVIGTVNVSITYAINLIDLWYTCAREEPFPFLRATGPGDDATTTPTRRGLKAIPPSIGSRGGVVGLMLIVTSSLRPSRELTFR